VNIIPHLQEAKDKCLPTASTRTIPRWFNHYGKYGDVPAVTRRLKIRQRRMKGGYRNSMTLAELEVLQEIVDSYPYLYLDEIRQELYERTGGFNRYSDPTIWRALTKTLGYSLQVVTNRARQQDEEQRDAYLAALRDLVHDPKLVVFIDETAKDLNSARRRRHWSKKQKTPIRDAFFVGDNASKRWTMLSACDVQGFILEACELVERETSSNDANPMRGTIDRDRFKLWVEVYLIPVLGNYEAGEPRSLVVLDNASIHHDDDIVMLIESVGARVLFTAPYSPDLNPIEYMFGKYKEKLKRHHGSPHREGADMVTCHIRALLSITSADAGSLFRHCKVPGCEHFTRMREGKNGQLKKDRSLVVAMVASAAAIATVATLGV
jgi:transposase